MSAPLIAPTRRIFELTLGELLARRTAFVAIAAAAPVLLALVARLALASGSATFIVNGNRLNTGSMFATVVSLLYLRFVVPALGLFYGTSLIADEVEEKTITYLFVRPIARGAVVLGKYLAYLLCAFAFVLPSAALVFIAMVPFKDMGPLFGTLLRDLALIALGLVAYGAVFLLVGVVFKRPLVGGLIFIFGWEPMATALPGYLGQFTIAHHLQATAAGEASLFVLTITALAAAMRIVEQREYVLEQ
jgi:ABC-2 type transport system permease protein